MSEEKFSLRGRTLLPGKVISNFGQSSIDCVVRRISDHGATINVESALGEIGRASCRERVWR